MNYFKICLGIIMVFMLSCSSDQSVTNPGQDSFGSMPQKDDGSIVVTGGSSGPPPVSGVHIQIILPEGIDPENPIIPINSQPVYFLAQLTDGAGNIVLYWDFGDGSEMVNGILVDHTYNDCGEHLVGVTAKDFDPVSGELMGEASDLLSIFIECVEIPVDIDIKPGSYPNSINLGSRGTIPVAIFSTPDFDATTVNPITITLADAAVKIKGNGTPMSSAEDINGDGFIDLLVHVETQGLSLTPGDTEAVLLGETFAGLEIRGTDTIRVVP